MTKKTWKNMRTMLPSVLLALTAGWFTACSSDEENIADNQPVPQQQAIGFGGGTVGSAEQGKPISRSNGEIGLEEKTKSFIVWGFKHMQYDEVDGYGGNQVVFDSCIVRYDGQPGSSTDNTDGWSYVRKEGDVEQTIKYWDFSAKGYRFYAIAGHAPKIKKSVADDHSFLTLSLSDLDSDSPIYFSHMWFSNNDPNDPEMPKYGQQVKLKFFQPYCQVRFMFVDDQGKPLTADSEVAAFINKKTISFKPVNEEHRYVTKKGLFMVSYSLVGHDFIEFRMPQPEKDNIITLDTPYESEGNLVLASEAEKWYTVFPSVAEEPFVLNLEYNGIERKAMVPKEYTHWDMNHEYTYVFKISELGLEFCPELYVHGEWQSGYTMDVPVEW